MVISLKFIVTFHLQIRIKQEKLSDSEEKKLPILAGLEKIKAERGETSDESESESESDESKSNERADDTSSSDTNINTVNKQPLKEIKKEKEITTPETFIPRPIKSEPQSDTEGTSKFKTPTSNHKLKKNKNQSFDDVSTFVSPIMSSTLKIKQEPASEDESGNRKKRKITQNSKSFESIENDLFNSFLK